MGEYWFLDLEPGVTYTVTEEAPIDSDQTTPDPAPIFLESGFEWVANAAQASLVMYEYNIPPDKIVIDPDLAFGNSYCTPAIALCDDVTVMLDSDGTVSIVPSDVDNGSSYECGLESMTVMPNTFTCEDAGTHLVTLTVTDVNAASSTCSAVVTVQRPPSLSFEWTGVDDDDWMNPLNWNMNCLPMQGDQVLIPAATPYGPDVHTGDHGRSGTLTIENGAVLTVDGVLTVEANSGLNAVENQGTVSVNGSLLFSGGNFVNDGLLKGYGEVLEAGN
jgi:hypothetical protein